MIPVGESVDTGPFVGGQVDIAHAGSKERLLKRGPFALASTSSMHGFSLLHAGAGTTKRAGNNLTSTTLYQHATAWPHGQQPELLTKAKNNPDHSAPSLVPIPQSTPYPGAATHISTTTNVSPTPSPSQSQRQSYQKKKNETQ
jgi:hypothetical protein